MSLYEIFPDKSCEIIDLKPPSTINLDNRPFEWLDYDYYITLTFKIYSKFYF